SSQLIIGILVSFIAGFLITWLASSFGIGIDNYVSTSIFITVAIFAFFMMILATLELIGIGAIPLYVLLMFFGIPLLTMPLEFMPTFYSHYIYPWLPMRFFVDGLKELFFFNNDFTWNYPTMILTYIAIVSTLVLGLTAFKKAKHKPKKRTV
ncbi:MAG: phage infection protein, partial [Bacilli bacterium]|nr:phage infection protein [Bacilli bacterium]